MANQNVVFDETKKVLELMEESEENISLLVQDLKQTEKLCEDTISELNTLQNKKTEITADLEENQNFKSNIKEYNESVVNLAQQVYSCGQQLYMEVDSRENEIEEIEKTLNKNDEIFLKKLKEYKEEEDKLKAELELLKEENAKEEESQKLQDRNLHAENNELNNELDLLNKQIEQCELVIEKNDVVDRVTKYKEEIATIKECLRLIDQDFCKATTQIDEIEKNQEIADAEANLICSEMDEKISKYETELERAMEELERDRVAFEELMEKVKKIHGIDRDAEHERYNVLLEQLAIQIEEDYRAASEKIFSYEKICFQKKELRGLQEQLNKKLRAAENDFKTRCQAVDVDLDRIKIDITNVQSKISKVDLNNMLEAKRVELEELKTARRDIKEQYNKKLSDLNETVTNLTSEIEEIELKNKQLQEEIDTLEMDINRMEKAKDENTKMRVMEEEMFKLLEEDINKVVGRLAGIKSLPPTLKRKLDAFKVGQAVKQGASEKKPRVERHWDSDSSVEGEDRRFSDMAKQKIRMRKLQGEKR